MVGATSALHTSTSPIHLYDGHPRLVSGRRSSGNVPCGMDGCWPFLQTCGLTPHNLDMSTKIDTTQKTVHVASETFALLVVAPFLLYAATRKRELRPIEKGLLATAAIGTFLVDGWLLYRFKRDLDDTAK